MKKILEALENMNLSELRAECIQTRLVCKIYRKALKKIARDFGTDNCDGNTLEAKEALDNAAALVSAREDNE